MRGGPQLAPWRLGRGGRGGRRAARSLTGCRQPRLARQRRQPPERERERTEEGVKAASNPLPCPFAVLAFRICCQTDRDLRCRCRVNLQIMRRREV